MEHTPETRLHAQYVEEFPAHPKSLRISNFAAPREIESIARPGQYSGKSLLAFPDLLPDRIREHWPRADECPDPAGVATQPHVRQLVRVLDGKGPQAYCIQELEDCSICADAERKRCDSDYRESNVQA
jgi:hypothetical protein